MIWFDYEIFLLLAYVAINKIENKNNKPDLSFVFND